MRVTPEFMALLAALTIYTAGFIAEIVRAGILAVSHGQTEAAYALGVRPGPTLRLIIIPQALRVIIPPLTSQYLNLTKNSSLAVAIAYPDLVSVGGTILNQTGQAVEIIAHLDDRLSDDQSAHIGIHELVQPARCAGGTLRRRSWRNDQNRRRAEGCLCPRPRWCGDLPAPNLSVGVIGWMRENLFNGVLNTLLTLFGCICSTSCWCRCFSLRWPTQCGRARTGKHAWGSTGPVGPM
jgi:hypothetical protein